MLRVLSAFLFIHFCFADYKYTLTIGALFQNEAPYLREWIEYHKLLGVEHFILFNNYSSDNYLEVLKPYIECGEVELKEELTRADTIQIFYPMQCKCYTQCCQMTAGVTKWIAFLDIDEFLVPSETETLPEFLKEYEKYGGIGANWRLFGTSYVKKIPENQLLIETLTLCTPTSYPDNRYIKCIVRPERVLTFDNAHLPTFKPGFFGVNTSKFPLEGPMSEYILTNKLRVNHYWTRDEHFFYQTKIPRHQKWGGKADPQQIFQKMNVEKDELILRFAPRLKKTLFNAT